MKSSNLGRWAVVTIVATVAVGVAARLSADDAEVKKDTTAGMGVRSPKQNDLLIVRWLDVDHRGIIDCATLVAKKTDNATLKQFAETISEEHRKIMEECKACVDRQEDKQPATSTFAVVTKDDGASRDGQWAFTPTNFVSVKENVCAALKSEMAAMMNDLSGPAFDKAACEHCMCAHRMLEENIKAVRKTSTKELAECLDKASEKIRAHVEKCKEMCKKPAN